MSQGQFARQQADFGHQRHQNLDVAGHRIVDIAGLANVFQPFFFGQQLRHGALGRGQTRQDPSQIAVAAVIFQPEPRGPDQKPRAAQVGQNSAKIGYGNLLEPEVCRLTECNPSLRKGKIQRAMVTNLFKKSKQLSGCPQKLTVG